MNATSIIAIAVAVVVVLGAIAFLTLRASLRRARRRCAQPRDPPARPLPRRCRASGRAPARNAAEAEAEARGRPHRRRRSCRSSRAGAAGAVGAARPRGDRRQPPAVLQPGDGRADERRHRRRSRRRASWRSCGRSTTGGFGGKVAVGKLDDIIAGIRSRRAASSTPPRRAPGSRRTRPTRSPRPRPSTTSRCSPACERASIALYQKCPHLGCRVPQCVSSQWFECPCHGSQYNRVGEKKGGPAPRGMDHFPRHRRRQRRRHRRHRHRRQRPADRHQHHRPGGRGSALHRDSRSTDASALATTSIAWVTLRRSSWSAGSSTPSSTSGVGAPRARLGDRAGAPTASRTTTTRRSRARASSVLQLLGVLLLVIIVVGLPLYWMLEPEPAGRRDRGPGRSGSSTGAAQLFAPTAQRRLQLRRLPRRHEGRRRRRPVQPSPTGHTVRSRRSTWNAPALNTIFYRFDEEEVRFILVYGRPFSPMSPWGLAGGGPMNDQQIDTLLAYLHEHPDRARELRRRRGRPAGCAPSGHLPGRRSGRDRRRRANQARRRTATFATLRRGAVQPRLAAARTAAPAATPRAGATASPASPARARSAGTSPAAPPTRTSRTRPT